VDRLGLVNRRGAARVAAPAAFLAGVTVAVILIRSGFADGEPTTTQVQATTRATTTTTTRRATTRARQPVFATVESGDTLDQIALDNDTTVERLLELNPELDPRELQVGQRIRVR
jgi:hypothetical protein